MAIYSIGQLAKLTDCKVPTIRYYETIGLLNLPARTLGNQRRYNSEHLSRLQFIRHSRALGFNLEEISQLIHLQGCAKHSPHDAHAIATSHLLDIQKKIRQLQALEHELAQVTNCCNKNTSYQCKVLEALNDF